MESPPVIRVLSSSDIDDLSELISLFEDVFEMKDLVRPGRDYFQQLLAKPGFFVLVATIKDRVVGGLTTYVLDQYYSTKPLAYIYDLAVDRNFQRKGIGKRLIEHLRRHCGALGFEEVFVQADRVDAYALDFYRSTGADLEEDVIHFTYRLPA